MKLALIFVLSTLVVVSHQQFYQQRPTSRGMLWWLPYYSPQRVLNDYQPLYNDQPAEDLPFPRQSSSSGSVNYFQNGELLNEGTDGGQDYVEDDGQNEYGDIQSRNRGFAGVSSSFGGFSRYRPSFYNERPDGRFFFNFGNSNANRLLKTATFQLTSTVTLTTVSRCVPSIQFAVSPPPACRRKRSVIDDAEDDDQFVIDPSETLELTPTALPGRQSRETRQVMDKSHSDDSLISSQNAEIPFGEMSKVDQFMANLRDKRFFLNRNSFFTSTTMTSYTFISTTITQTVSLGPGSAAVPAVVGPPAVPAVAAVPGVLKCLPAGYSICP